jgi:hypothetical protein
VQRFLGNGDRGPLRRKIEQVGDGNDRRLALSFYGLRCTFRLPQGLPLAHVHVQLLVHEHDPLCLQPCVQVYPYEHDGVAYPGFVATPSSPSFRVVVRYISGFTTRPEDAAMLEQKMAARTRVIEKAREVSAKKRKRSTDEL